MKILLMCLLTVFSFAEPSKDMFNDLKVDRINNLTKLNTKEQNISLEKNQDYVNSLKEELNKYWVNNNGFAKLKFIVDSNTGKIVKYFIVEKEGSEIFMTNLNSFLNKTKEINFKKVSLKEPILEITMSFGKKPEPIISSPSSFDYTLFSKEQSRYKKAIEYFIKEKNISKESIKKELNRTENSYVKDILFAIYNEFEKKDLETAKKHYEIISTQYLEQMKQNKEAFFISDYLVKEKRFKELMFLFPDRSCQLFEKNMKYECYYYQSVAMFFSGKDYEIPLNLAKTNLKKAEEFHEQIKKGAIKK